MADAEDPSPPLRFDALGRDRIDVEAGATRVLLSPRHSEIVVLLAHHRDGLTAEQLAAALYGDLAKPVTARAEVSRLRRLLGERLRAEPYRIAGPVDSDAAAVRRLLLAGRVRQAATLHSDVLLPRSEAPGVAALREELEAWTREAVMASGDVDALWSWATTSPGAGDLAVWARFLSVVPYDDWRRARAAARIARLRRRYVVATTA